MAKHNKEPKLLILPRRTSREMKLLYLILGIQVLILILFLKK